MGEPSEKQGQSCGTPAEVPSAEEQGCSGPGRSHPPWSDRLPVLPHSRSGLHGCLLTQPHGPTAWLISSGFSVTLQTDRAGGATPLPTSSLHLQSCTGGGGRPRTKGPGQLMAEGRPLNGGAGATIDHAHGVGPGRDHTSYKNQSNDRRKCKL